MTTIYDVARAAGVTAATVSYVLSGKGSVSEVTRERVLKCAQDLGYRPNMIARSLINQSTRTIGFVVPSIGNPFYAVMAEAIECLTYTAGFRVFITNTYRDDCMAQNLLNDLLSRHVDGIIVVSEIFALARALQALQTTSSEPLPVVVCLWEEHEPDFAPSISYDFFAAGRLAAEHLLELGHRRIGVVVDGVLTDGSPEKIHHPARLAGFQEALAQSGSPLDLSLLRLGDSSLESGKAAGIELLQLPEPPTAIFATNDLMALGVISAAWELGIVVPQQLSVIGFDDIRQAAYHVPPLTTIIMRESDIAEQALKLLFRMIEGKPVISPPRIQPVLVVRGSTAPLVTEATLPVLL